MGEDENSKILRERFNSLLPKYGTLWKSMILTSKNSNNNNSSSSSSRSKEMSKGKSLPRSTTRHHLSDIDLNISSADDNDRTTTQPSISDESNNIPIKNPSNNRIVSNFIDAISSGEKVIINSSTNKHVNSECDVIGCVGDCMDPIIDFDSVEEVEKSIGSKKEEEYFSNENRESDSKCSSSSGEDIASIAFDLSHLSVQSNLVEEEEEEQENEDLNLTVFTEDLGKDEKDLKGNDLQDSMCKENHSPQETFLTKEDDIEKEHNGSIVKIDKSEIRSMSNESHDHRKISVRNGYTEETYISASENDIKRVTVCQKDIKTCESPRNEKENSCASCSTSSGEDIASIAFDLSHMIIQSDDSDDDDDDDDGTEEKENSNTTIFAKDFGYKEEESGTDNVSQSSLDFQTRKGKSDTVNIKSKEKECKEDVALNNVDINQTIGKVLHANEDEDFSKDDQSNKIDQGTKLEDDFVDDEGDKINSYALNTSISSTISCKDFFSLVKDLDEVKQEEIQIADAETKKTEKQKSCLGKKDGNVEENAGSDDIVCRKIDYESQSKNYNEVMDEDKNVADIDGNGNVPSLGRTKNLEDSNFEHSTRNEERKSTDSYNLHVEDGNSDRCRSTEESSSASSFEEEKKEGNEKIYFHNQYNMDCFEQGSERDSTRSESENDSIVSKSTSEEEWDDASSTESKNASSESSGSPEASSRRRGSFTVMIVSDDDISYYDSDDESFQESSITCSEEEKVEEETEEEEEEENEFEEDENHFDHKYDGNSSKYGTENDEHSIIAISSSDDSEKNIYTEGRNRSKDKAKEKRMKTIDKNKSTSSAMKSSGMTSFAFKRNRESLSIELFNQFNKQAFDNALSHVPVTWSKRLLTTAGITRLKRRGQNKSATIELSTKVIDNNDKLRATLLHEMCHAAQWLVNGVAKPSHGACFKKWANIAMRKVPNVQVTTTHNYVIAYKYAWACSTLGCPTLIKRQSRSVDPKKHICSKCKGILVEIEVPQSNDRTSSSVKNISHTPKKKRQPSGFSLFVQQNSKSVRERLLKETRGVNILQKDVMKECGRLWRERKSVLPQE